MDVDRVLGGEDAVLVLARRVHHEQLELLVSDLQRLVERVLYCGVIGVHKLALKEWTYYTYHISTYHHQFNQTVYNV